MYKKIISLMLSLLLILSMTTAVCGETENSVSVFVNRYRETITISGCATQREVPIYILKKGKTIDDISDRSIILNILQATADSSGNYSVTTGYEGYTECTVCVCLDDTYIYKDVDVETTEAGLGNIYGFPETLGALSGTTTKEMFQNARAELPMEMPVYAPMEIEGQRYIYVSPGANGDGSIDKPYGKLSEATADAKKNPEGTVIYLREGNYGAEQITALKDVIASSESPLMISAYPGEKVVFTAGINLKRSDFKEVDDKEVLKRLPMHTVGNVLSVNLKEMGITQYGSVTNATFSVDNIGYTLARYPNVGETGMLEYTGDGAENGVIDSGPITSSQAGSDCGNYRETGLYGENGFEIVVEDTRPFSWVNTDQIYAKGSFYEEWSINTVRIKEFKADTQSIRTYTGLSTGVKYKEDNSFYYFNVFEEMDTPGEWFMDRDRGILYIYPHAEFEEANFSYNESSMISLTNCKNVVISGIKFKSSSSVRAISITNGENILVQKCDFERTKAGVFIMGESKFCGVINSVFNSISGYPIAITEPSVSGEIVQNLIPQYNFIQNNYVYDSESVIIRGNSSIVSHNVITNSKNHGIAATHAHDIVIEYNEIGYGNTEISDSGAIYVAGNRYASGGNHVRYNYIYKCKENRNGNYGIYFDDFMSRSYIYGNIMEDTYIFIHNGSDNAVYNNVVSNVKSQAIKDSNNYLKTFHSRWEGGCLQYGSFTEFLNKDAQGYIDVTSDTSPYVIRYPKLKDWAEKMYQRIEEYESNGVVTGSSITATYLNGTTTDLDTYLRSPRYNYYDKNLMVVTEGGYITTTNALKLTEEGTISAETGTNYTVNLQKVYPKESNPFETGYTVENFVSAQALLNGFEKLPIENMGIRSGLTVTNNAPIAIYPSNGQIVDVEDVSFKWISNPGNNVLTLCVSENADMSDTVLTKQLVESEYALSENERALLTEGKTYYWQVTAESKTTTGVTGTTTINSDIYSFTVNGENLNYTPGGIYVCSIENNGENVTNLANETALQITAYAYNKQKSSFDNVTIFAASYGEDDILLDVKLIPIVTLKASSFTEDLIFNLTNTKGTQKIKLFMWDNNMRPLSYFREVK